MNIETRDPALLHPHPALKNIPAPAKDGPEVCAAADSIREADGYLLPIVVDDRNNILTDDSRLRWMAARRMGLAEVPVTEQPAALAPIIVVTALIHRAHLTKSALAYLAIPLLKPALEAARMHRVDILKSGGKSVAHAVGYAKNLDEIAASLGISPSLLDAAKQVHAAFESDRKFTFTIEGGPDDGATAELTLREYFEPKILRQQVDSEHADARPLGLGGVLKAIGSIKATKGAPKRTDSQLQLFTDGFSAVEKRFRYWSDFGREEKAAARERISTWVQSMPEDLRETVRAAIEQLDAKR